MVLEKLVGKTFVNEVALEKEVKILVPLKEMYSVLEGFVLKTVDGSIYKIFATSTIGELTVTAVK